MNLELSHNGHVVRRKGSNHPSLLRTHTLSLENMIDPRVFFAGDLKGGP